MALGQRLELRQTTRLVMTPQLRQAIRLLQMTGPELAAFVAGEAERNPLLETEAAGEVAARPEPEPRLEDRLRASEPGAAEAELDAGREAFWDEAPADLQAGWRQGGGRGAAAEGTEGFDQLAEPPRLRDHLLAQIGLARAPAPILALARLLVDELDEAGYLRADPAAIAAGHGLGADAGAAALRILQSCAPTGIGARNLAECLALQLAERNRLDPAMQAVLDHLPLLAEGRYERLMALSGVGREDLAGIVAEIRALDPRPGLALAGGTAAPVVPDILVRRDRTGGWIVELNEAALPRLLVNNRYAARLAQRGGPVRSFVSECRTSANWLVRTLESRARTILRVGTELVRRQDGFLARGISALRPMTLRDVAEATGMHESTVSRVVTGKYLACDRGIFELRLLFSNGVAATDGGDAVAAAAIRERIRRMIEEEDPRRILSDDTIVSRLRHEGVDIARRTVAKYREAMNIPSSVQRRRLKAGPGMPGQDGGAARDRRQAD